MIFFKELQGRIALRFPDAEKAFVNGLAGGVVNTLFGVINNEQAYVDFVLDHQKEIEELLGEIGNQLPTMRIPLTDALRVMVLCDSLDGQDDTQILSQAESFGILLTDRDLPMPNKFIELVRKIGAVYGLLSPPEAEGDEAG